MSNRHPSQLVSVVFRLPLAKLERVRELSKDTRVRQSEFLREAIADLLVKHGDVIKCVHCGELGAINAAGQCPACWDLQLAWERSQLTCGCGRAYTWAEYLGNLAPPIAGSQQESEDELGAPIMIELRQCACHNTMARLPLPMPKGWTP